MLIAMPSVGLSVQVGVAQSVADSQVRAVSLDRSSSPGQMETVRFARRPSQVGDVMEQTIAHDLQLTTIERQGNNITDKSTKAVRHHQRRIVTTTRVDKGRAAAVRVKYLEAGKLFSEGESPAAPRSEAEAIAGKTYLCQRAGEKLVVTDEEGRIPPPIELELVAGDMEAIGRSSPLAEFLDGRTVAVGQRLELPLALADRLLALKPEFGKLTRFELVLKEVRDEAGTHCAVFQASIEAVSQDSSQLHLQVAGPMAVEIDSCRAASSQLSGPIAMSESRGSYSAAYQLISTGRLSLGFTSIYRDAAR